MDYFFTDPQIPEGSTSFDTRARQRGKRADADTLVHQCPAASTSELSVCITACAHACTYQGHQASECPRCSIREWANLAFSRS
eukprot:6072387-Alexandrium_andersonii.AAC.1